MLKEQRGGGPDPDEVNGFAAGGRISQKINRDSLPTVAYDVENGARLHLSVINAAHFSAITGLPAPSTPINSKTYLEMGLPWYALFDEHVEEANTAPTALANIKSVSEVNGEEMEEGGVEAFSVDERIMTLKRYAARGTTISFKLDEHRVSGLSGH